MSPDRAAHLVELRGVARRYDMGELTVTALEGGPDPGAGRVRGGARPLRWQDRSLNMIGALDSPTEGAVAIAGQDITSADRSELFRIQRHEIGFIFQTFNLFPALTALENVEFGAEVAGHESPRDAARTTLERVGLGERIEHFPHELSGGEQQRVAIARALAGGNRFCSPTSRPASSTSRPACRSSTCSTSRRTSRAPRS